MSSEVLVFLQKECKILLYVAKHHKEKKKKESPMKRSVLNIELGRRRKIRIVFIYITSLYFSRALSLDSFKSTIAVFDGWWTSVVCGRCNQRRINFPSGSNF